MDKKIAGLLGAVAAVATVGGAQASTGPAQSPNDALAARSYAELLAPVPNATEALIADDAARAQLAEPDGVKLAQDHHHHHHHGIVIKRHRRHHRHHHHHHHHHSSFIGVPGVGGVVVR